MTPGKASGASHTVPIGDARRMTRQLTQPEFWDKHWEERKDWVEVRRTRHGLYQNELLAVFDRYLPAIPGLKVLEIGGAPGPYLIYLAKRFGYQAYSLDYSSVGNHRTEENFRAAGIPVNIIERDLFAPNVREGLPAFDIVYSLGFIEHFDDLRLVIKKHLELVKPGGLLLLGVPNLTGIYGAVLRLTAPDLVAVHNTNTMYLENWRAFEKGAPMVPVFKGYVGGFEPFGLKRLERKTLLTRLINFFVKVLIVFFSYRFAFLRRFNSRLWSAYMMGVYRVD